MQLKTTPLAHRPKELEVRYPRDYHNMEPRPRAWTDAVDQCASYKTLTSAIGMTVYCPSTPPHSESRGLPIGSKKKVDTHRPPVLPAFFLDSKYPFN